MARLQDGTGSCPLLDPAQAPRYRRGGATGDRATRAAIDGSERERAARTRDVGRGRSIRQRLEWAACNEHEKLMQAFRIGRLFGIDIRVDWSWVFIFVLLTWNLSVAFSGWH